ncbi:hypothetical protein [Embleya scabrispora]|uniref:hypothetical protein n=1 Tax=Embleya scabrispora TaxID=159449 RepID=UPI00131A145C|nr:hypothetical protein [Embleya scabrispora]MYS88022.1 hypothetical protein [Streptomyces sp. SID5474]
MVQVVGSALAAISSAFLLSTLGVAGTVIGAALASVVATVGSAVYVHLFRRTGEQLRDVRATLSPPHEGGPSPDPTAVPDRPTGVAQRRPANDETMVLPVGDYERIGPSPGSPGGASRGETPSDGFADRRVWLGRSLVGAVLVFVVAMGVVTLAETAIGRSFASLFGHGDAGGSTISRIVEDRPARHDTPESPTGSTPNPTGTGTSAPTRSPGTDDKGTSGGPGGDGATPAPSTTPTTRPSNTPSPDPTGSRPPTTAPPATTPPGGSGGGAANGGAAAGNDAAGSARGAAHSDPKSNTGSRS